MKPLFDSPTFGRGKLVRDGVPAEILARGGAEPIEILPLEERGDALKAKVQEEAFEVAQTTTRDEARLELADLLEASMSLARELGLSWFDVVEEKAERASKRGAFAEGYFIREEHIR
jgi:predicted house-cleaning noncanonical NTP pyrophosphatase (MazG superfamily)